MKRIVRVTVWGAVAAAVVYTMLAVTIGVSFDRAVPLDNAPLTNALMVTSISSNRLTLEDGRVLVMEGYRAEELDGVMRESGNRLELGLIDSRCASVCVKRKRFI